MYRIPKNWQKKHLELKSNLSKIAEYKINTQKSTTCLYTIISNWNVKITSNQSIHQTVIVLGSLFPSSYYYGHHPVSAWQVERSQWMSEQSQKLTTMPADGRARVSLDAVMQSMSWLLKRTGSWEGQHGCEVVLNVQPTDFQTTPSTGFWSRTLPKGRALNLSFEKSRSLKGHKPTYFQSSENPLNNYGVLIEASLIWKTTSFSLVVQAHKPLLWEVAYDGSNALTPRWNTTSEPAHVTLGRHLSLRPFYWDCQSSFFLFF